MKAVSAKQAERIMDQLGQDYGDDGITYYAVSNDETEVWVFDTKRERDDFVKENKEWM